MLNKRHILWGLLAAFAVTAAYYFIVWMSLMDSKASQECMARAAAEWIRRSKGPLSCQVDTDCVMTDFIEGDPNDEMHRLAEEGFVRYMYVHKGHEREYVEAAIEHWKSISACGEEVLSLQFGWPPLRVKKTPWSGNRSGLLGVVGDGCVDGMCRF